MTNRVWREDEMGDLFDISKLMANHFAIPIRSGESAHW
jgi:hypothetical protein